MSTIGEAVTHDSISIYTNDDFTSENGVSGGSGTAVDPYIIEDLEISGPSTFCVHLTQTDRHVILRNLTLSSTGGATIGIELDRASNVTMENITSSDMGDHVSITGKCENVLIKRLHGTKGRVYLGGSKNVRMENSTLAPATPGGVCGNIYIDLSEVVSVVDCRLQSSTIDVGRGNGIIILNNRINDPRGPGIEMSISTLKTKVTIVGNTIVNCSRGITMDRVVELGIARNEIIDNEGYGMYLRDCQVDYILDNSVENKGIRIQKWMAGIDLRFPDMIWNNNTLGGEEILFLSSRSKGAVAVNAPQMVLVNCTNMTVSGIEIGGPWLSLLDCDRILVDDCGFRDLQEPIVVIGGNGTTISKCRFRYADTGISTWGTSNLTVRDTIITECYDGIVFWRSDHVTVVRNEFRIGSMGIGTMYSIGAGNEHTYKDNTFDNVEMAIWQLVIGEGYVIESNSIANSTVAAIHIVGSLGDKGLSILNNSIENCDGLGVDIMAVDDIRVEGNVINLTGTGIRLRNVVNGSILRNTISNSTSVGMNVTGTGGIVVKLNVISGSQNLAVYLLGSGNLAYLNNFVDNNQATPSNEAQAHSSSGNLWDNGSRGNYWSDYLDRYPGGVNNGIIWTPPYDLVTSGATARDHYPLVQPMDLEPPMADAGDDLTVDERTVVTLDGTGSWDDQGILIYTWTFQHQGQPVLLSGPTVDFEFTDPGEYWITLTVTDRGANTDSDVRVVTVLDVNDPPSILTDSLPAAQEDQPYTVVLEAIDIDPSGDVLTWQLLSDLPSFLVLDPSTGNLSGTPGDGDEGEWWINISVDDGRGGIANAILLLTVINFNDRPVITSDTPEEVRVDEDDEVLFLLTATDDDGDDLRWTDDTELFDIDPFTGTISATFGQSEVGSHDVTVMVHDDNLGIDTWMFTLVVIEVNDLPEITFLQSMVYISEYETYDHTMTAEDEEGGDITWSDDTDLFDISPTGGTVTFLATQLVIGEWIVNITAEDEGGLTDTVMVRFVISNVNDAPEIISITPENGSKFKQGKVVSMNAQTNDKDGDTLLITWYEGDEVLGTGTPFEYSELKPGKRTIRVEVEDGSETVEAEFTIIIKKEAKSPGPGLVAAMAAVVLAGLVVRRRCTRHAW